MTLDEQIKAALAAYADRHDSDDSPPNEMRPVRRRTTPVVLAAVAVVALVVASGMLLERHSPSRSAAVSTSPSSRPTATAAAAASPTVTSSPAHASQDSTGPATSPTAAAPPNSLYDQVWALTSVGGAPVPQQAGSPAASLYLSPAGYVAVAGCWLYQGTLSPTGASSLQPTPGGGLGGACGVALPARVQTALDALGQSPWHVAVNQDGLTVDVGGQLLRFTGAAPRAGVNVPGAAQLQNTSWQITTIGSVNSPVGGKAAITFTSDQYVLDDGCNRTFGYVFATATTVNLVPIGQTDSACATTANIAVDEAMQGRFSAAGTAGQLTLKSGHLAVGMRVSAAPLATTAHLPTPATGSGG
jgi:heat shock protein HslJ